MFGWFEKNKSLRPRKSFKENSRRNTLQKGVKKSLGSKSNFIEAVKLPKGESINEWYAVHVVDFYNNLNTLIYATGYIELEDPESMKAGEFEYLFKDDDKHKKPVKLAAHEYITLTLDFVEKKLNDEKCFPAENEKFPSNYKKIVKDIFKRLFRILAFLYSEKTELLQTKGLVPHTHTMLKHFLTFTFTHNLLNKKEILPLKKWIKKNIPEFSKKKKKKKDKDKDKEKE